MALAPPEAGARAERRPGRRRDAEPTVTEWGAERFWTEHVRRVNERAKLVQAATDTLGIPTKKDASVIGTIVA